MPYHQTGFETFEDLYRQHYHLARSIIFPKVRGDEDVTNDLTADTFRKVFERASEFDPRSDGKNITRWVGTIAKNCARDYVRTKELHRQKLKLIQEDDLHWINGQNNNTNGHLEEIVDAVNDLKPEFRDIIILSYWQDLAYKEISSTLRIPIGTVMSRLHHARNALRKYLIESGFEQQE